MNVSSDRQSSRAMESSPVVARQVYASYLSFVIRSSLGSSSKYTNWILLRALGVGISSDCF